MDFFYPWGGMDLPQRSVGADIQGRSTRRLQLGRSLAAKLPYLQPTFTPVIVSQAIPGLIPGLAGCGHNHLRP